MATAGRPVARHLDDGLTLEVNRTDGRTKRGMSGFMVLSGGQQKLENNVVLRTPGQMNQEHRCFAQLVLFV